MSVKEKFIQEATKMAFSSKCKYSLGAVLVKDGRIVSKSPNILMRCSTNTNFRWSSLHAEEAVISGNNKLPKGG